MSVTLEQFYEDLGLIRCDVCSGETLDLVPIGKLRVCKECVSPKKACCE